MGGNGFLDSIEFKGEASTDPALLSRFITENPLIEGGEAPQCAIRPRDVDELREIIKNKPPALVPVSSEGPHIRGGIACPVPHAVVDLSHWKKIPWINRRNRVCIIEPGVTYGELIKALAPHGMTVPMPLAPRSTKSVLAAVIDREPSTWANRQWDYQDPVASTEFLFGTGHLFRSGAAGGPGSLEEQRRSKGAQKAPQGPGQSDFQRVVMGSQGSLGVMTWISMRAELAPSVEEAFLVGDRTLDRLIPFFYQVQRPWLGEQAFILNRTAAALLMTHENPGSFTKVRESLPEFLALQNIAGFLRLPKERLGYQKADIAEMARDANLSLEVGLGDISAAGLLKAATSVCGPRDWRHGLSGHCLSVIFLSTLDRAPNYLATFAEAAEEAGVDHSFLGVYIQPVVQNHACHFELLVPFDPDDAEAVGAMKALERELCTRLIRDGAFFSRPYGAARDMAFLDNPGNNKLIKLAKDLFDPSGLLNPGKFGL